MTERTYLIWSNQHGAWWAPAERGYTQYIEEAGRYSEQRALAIVADATLDGRLRHTVESRRGEPLTVVDEVMVLAPECPPGGES